MSAEPETTAPSDGSEAPRFRVPAADDLPRPGQRVPVATAFRQRHHANSSALIGRPAPATQLPPLEGTDLPGIDSARFAGRVTVLNVFASWCAPCRDEHPVLVGLSKDDRYVMAGLNYKDKPENARRFLGDLGNPYAAIGIDEAGRTAIDWGVYGVPETFVIGKDGRIAYKHVGPVTPVGAHRAAAGDREGAGRTGLIPARRHPGPFSRRFPCERDRASRSGCR